MFHAAPGGYAMLAVLIRYLWSGLTPNGTEVRAGITRRRARNTKNLCALQGMRIEPGAEVAMTSSWARASTCQVASSVRGRLVGSTERSMVSVVSFVAGDR